MKSADYVGLTEDAVRAVISNRELQSHDFLKSQNLINLMTGCGSDEDAKQVGLKFIKNKFGYILVAQDEGFSSEKNTLTIDFSTCSFSAVSEALIISAIQKTFRFCVKYWGNLNFNNNEYIPPGSSKAIIFPYPMSSGNSYRITLERQPSEKRLSKRYTGKHLLAYRFGTSGGDGTKEDYPTTNFSKSIESLFSHDSYVIEKKKDEPQPIFLSTSLKDEVIQTKSILGSSDPYKSLSSKQLLFIKTAYDEPARIEGPAGSGKTICMVLKIIYWLNDTFNRNLNVKFLFIAPSQEMVNNVKYFLDVLVEGTKSYRPEILKNIEVKTLQEICTKFLKEDIHETELLDEDTLESKNMQLLHLVELVSGYKNRLREFKSGLSEELYKFFEIEDDFHIAELIRHEISVVIKGRSDEDFNIYKDIGRPAYGLPIKNINDRKFVFEIFSEYSEVLDNISQFDVDDIAISALSKLDSPIWRRRRKNDGYDAIFIDEVHLFNMNELSLVHFLTKDSKISPISYAIDLSQALGDIAWNDNDFNNSVGIKNGTEEVILSAVFRSSPAITDLAFSITSHGANIFTNFDNPITESPYIYDSELEDRIPRYYLIDGSQNIYLKSFELADVVRDELKLKKHEVAIIFFDRFTYSEGVSFATETRKRFVEITKRGDLSSVAQAEKISSYILTMADYVGGLEFEAVILVGVDKGRIPDDAKANSTATKMYQNYVAHNRLYVSVTRARKDVVILGEAIRGASDVLESAITNKKIELTK
ncbi:TPA: UvrD-helicase domain-containing protein [Serratia marcescens]|nr:UvrD-helicase domain-containing protein [Serratia marcescens]HEI9731531.1 UvrD-helicase domain-containing protein [Serratia marcescens]